MIYLRGCRMVVACLRHSNQVTEGQRWKHQPEWPRLELETSRILSKPCECSAHILHQPSAVNRHILCSQRGSNSASPRSWVLLEKPIVAQIKKKIPNILCNLLVHYHVHKSRELVPILSQINPALTTPNYLSKIHVNIILPLTSVYS
jgi:hypothetical protein